MLDNPDESYKSTEVAYIKQCGSKLQVKGLLSRVSIEMVNLLADTDLVANLRATL